MMFLKIEQMMRDDEEWALNAKA